MYSMLQSHREAAADGLRPGCTLAGGSALAHSRVLQDTRCYAARRRSADRARGTGCASRSGNTSHRHELHQEIADTDFAIQISPGDRESATIHDDHGSEEALR